MIIMMMMMMIIITIMSFVYPRQYFEALMLVRVSKFLKQIKPNRVKNRPTGLRQTSWLFTNMVEDLNSGQLRTNPASGQGGT